MRVFGMNYDTGFVSAGSTTHEPFDPERFGGPVGYASIPLEAVDWAPFDIIASDAGYRDATNAATLPQTLAAALGQGKPYAATEFGCCTFHGAADVAGGTEPVTYDEHGRAAKLTAKLERDEEGPGPLSRGPAARLRSRRGGGGVRIHVREPAPADHRRPGGRLRPGRTRDRAGAAGRLVDAEGRLPRLGRYGRNRSQILAK